MKIKVKILIFCMVFVAKNIQAQSNDYKSLKTNNKNIFYLLRSPSVTPPIKAINMVPRSFYTDNFGFFCKKEWQLEKVVKVPLKFRLGSIQQVDYLEGKGNGNYMNR